MALAQGTKLGSYEIQSAIGAGGMGEVYRARDLRLGRDVAIKILPAKLAANAELKQRFEREAKAISSLQHPNICALYDVGSQDGIEFLVMEFLEGETLAARLRRGALPMDDVLRIGIDLSDALASAHARGVVHRDIKPGNIFLTSHGHIKVLDFGLAKLADEQPVVELGATIDDRGLTQHGTAVGTVAYMSPEQALGKPIDSRTDIFSFGAVLYEMATGRAAFDGTTTAAIFDAILNRQPPEPSGLRTDFPEELLRIIRRALEKDRDLRYQNAADLRAELKRAQRDIGSGRIDAAHPDLTNISKSKASAPSGSDSQLVVAMLRKHRGAAIGVITVVVVLLIAAAYGAFQLSRKSSGGGASGSLAGMRIVPLTTSGTATRVAISPDGKYVANVSGYSGNYSLWLRQTATGSNVQIVPPAEGSFRGISFSRDGNYIFYSRKVSNKDYSWDLYRIAVLGGVPEKIVNDVDSPPTFSPDAKQFAYVMKHEKGADLKIANADGSGARILYTSNFPNLLYSEGACWSPDGSTIVVSMQVMKTPWHSELLAVPAGGGAPQQIHTPDWFYVGQCGWLPGGKKLLLTASEGATSNSQIWELAFPDGAARRVTNDLDDYSGVDISTSGDAFVTTQQLDASSISVTGVGDFSQTRRISSSDGELDGRSGLDWLPDGRIVYISSASGGDEVWEMKSDGSGAQRLTSAPPNQLPRAIADGSAIFFISGRGNTSRVWKMAPDGSGATPVSDGGSEVRFDVSQDGKNLFYMSTRSGSWGWWKQSLAGGQPVEFDSRPSDVAVSPDGNSLVVFSILTESGISELPVTGGSLTKLFDPPMDITGIRPIAWTPDGKNLAYMRTENGVGNIWLQPLGGGAPRQITHFSEDRIFAFAFSRDGKQLALARGTSVRNAVMISNFR